MTLSARTEAGPRIIIRHDAERVVVQPSEDFRAFAAHKPHFKTYLLGGRKVDDFAIGGGGGRAALEAAQWSRRRTG